MENIIKVLLICLLISCSENPKTIQAPIVEDNIKLEIDASVGAAFYPHDGINSHALLRSADVAMYEAKRKGNNLAFYESSVDKHTPERLSLIAELNNAIRSKICCFKAAC